MIGVKIIMIDTFKNLYIDEVWPISTEIVPNGGIGIYWSGAIGFGQFILYWGEDDKLHADTECLSSNENKDFIKAILNLLVEEVIVDG